jgi:DNA-binding MarR family transcriptional regulator
LLDRLQEDGWIERRGSAEDRRCKIIHLQRRSKAVLDKIFNAAHDLRKELIEDIPKRDLETCIRVLGQIKEKAELPVDVAENGHRELTKGARLS